MKCKFIGHRKDLETKSHYEKNRFEEKHNMHNWRKAGKQWECQRYEETGKKSQKENGWNGRKAKKSHHMNNWSSSEEEN